MDQKPEKKGGSFFQMPLHYPKYSKKDYEDMPEWKLDRLLAEYGLPIRGDLPYKRQFAMGAFLWTDFHHTFKDPSLLNKKVK